MRTRSPTRAANIMPVRATTDRVGFGPGVVHHGCNMGGYTRIKRVVCP